MADVLLPDDPTVPVDPITPVDPVAPVDPVTPADPAAQANWYDQYKEHPVLKDSIKTLDRYKTVDDALIDLNQKNKTLSGKLVDIPAEGADTETVGKFLNDVRSKLPEQYKVPETADGYNLSATIPGENGEGEIPIPVNDSSLKEIQIACHKCNIDNETFNNLVKEVFSAQANAPARAMQQIKDWLVTESKVNNNTPSYDEFKNTVNSEYKTWPDELRDAAKDIPNETLARVIHHYAKQNGEYKFPDNTNSTSTKKTLLEINDEISVLMRDPDYIRESQMCKGTKWDKHAALVEERKKMQRGEK